MIGDVPRAVDVVTAVLIVTCPCAFGIATPMAYELVQAGLRRAGLFVRAPGFLDRAVSVRRVVFDKTGTLTTGSLAVRDAAPLAALDADSRALLYNLAARSTHPKSVAVKRALEALGVGETDAFAAGLGVVEHAGLGVEVTERGSTWRFGAPAWAAKGAESAGDVAFGRDGELLAGVDTDEKLRPDARDEVAGLGADQEARLHDVRKHQDGLGGLAELMRPGLGRVEAAQRVIGLLVELSGGRGLSGAGHRGGRSGQPGQAGEQGTIGKLHSRLS